jgi:hypothetical protein
VSAAQPSDCGTQVVEEPSAWLRSTGARRARQIRALHLDASAFGVLIAPLGQTGPPGSREDRSCDRCRTYVPEPGILHVFVYRPDAQIHLCGGLCPACARKEAGQ